MIFSNDVAIHVAMVLLGMAGFLVARHIYKHKNNEQNPLVCPIKFDCHTVVHSDYSKFFGVPVEILGMIYYSVVTVFYLLVILTPGVLPGLMAGAMVIFSKIAFLFSLYLIGVQIFVLRKGCSWCIVSAGISTLIFIFSLFNYDFSVITGVLHKFF